MSARTKIVRGGTLVAAAVLVAVGPAMSDETPAPIRSSQQVAVGDLISGDAPVVTVVESDVRGFTLWLDTPGFRTARTQTAAGEFLDVRWPDASIAGAIGQPALPVVRRLFVAPQKSIVRVTASEGEAQQIDLDRAGLPWRVIPVQPPIEKIPGAIERAVFQFDQAGYVGRKHLSDVRATVEELGVARGRRLFLLEVRPVAYDPDARSLTLWHQLAVRVEFVEGKAYSGQLSPLPGLGNIVLNPDQAAASKAKGSGNYLIIVDTAYESAIASFASAKAGQGFSVTTHTVDGESNAAIKSYIESLWGGSNSPDYILLVGDTDTIPHWTGGGEGSPYTDLP